MIWETALQLSPGVSGHVGLIELSSVLCPVLQSLWVERTTLTLVQSLPGISRWFEVDKRELVRHKYRSEPLGGAAIATRVSGGRIGL